MPSKGHFAGAQIQLEGARIGGVSHATAPNHGAEPAGRFPPGEFNLHRQCALWSERVLRTDIVNIRQVIYYLVRQSANMLRFMIG